MAYATVEDVAAGFRTLSEEEQALAAEMLEEAAVIIDAYAENAADDEKRVVSCRMVRRNLGTDTDGGMSYPAGTTQGSVSALGYSQSWTVSGGSVGELYLSKLEKKLLGVGDRIGAGSVLEGLTC